MMIPIKLKNIISTVKVFQPGEDTNLYYDAEAIVEQKSIQTYFSKTIQQKANISENHIKHWTNTDVIKPYMVADRSGKMHVYDHINLLESIICTELSAYSINYRMMKKILEFLRTQAWCFELALYTKPVTYTGNSPNMEMNLLKKKMTIWDFYRLYPLHYDLYLLLWRSTPLIVTNQNIGNFSFHVADIQNLHDINERCLSVITINLTNIVFTAGHFFEEGK